MILSLEKRFIFVKGIKVAGSSVEFYLAEHVEPEAVVTEMIYEESDAALYGQSWRPRNFRNHHGFDDFYDHIPATAIRAIVGTWLYERLYKFGIVRDPFEKIRSLYFMRRIWTRPDYSLQDAVDECTSESDRLCDGDSLIVHRVIRCEELDAGLAEILPSLRIPFGGTLSYRARSGPRALGVG